MQTVAIDQLDGIELEIGSDGTVVAYSAAGARDMASVYRVMDDPGPEDRRASAETNRQNQTWLQSNPLYRSEEGGVFIFYDPMPRGVKGQVKTREELRRLRPILARFLRLTEELVATNVVFTPRGDFFALTHPTAPGDS